MPEFYEPREAQAPGDREADFFRRFVPFLVDALQTAHGLARHLGDIDASSVMSRRELSALPVLRKDRLMALQAEDPPFGGFAPGHLLPGMRVFMSPGPLWEPQPPGTDPWGVARALYAARFRRGDLVLNAYAYHMTPGAFIMEEGARALGCTVFPAGTGSTEVQAAAVAALKPIGYLGTPDFLKLILDKAAEAGQDSSSLTRALVSGGALFPSLREDYASRGIAVLQAYATADLGLIAYETTHEEKLCEGMVVNEDILVEIVRPGTGDPVADGEVGEVVVTTLNPAYPLVRFGTGDLSAVVAGPSPCGRTGMRLKGWMGRADQRTKVKGMFVDPAQIASIARKHPAIARLRLVVTRENDLDAIELQVEAGPNSVDAGQLEQDFQAATGLRVRPADIVAVPSLPNDGKVIDDRRRYD